jgi:hypothetical protein
MSERAASVATAPCPGPHSFQLGRRALFVVLSHHGRLVSERPGFTSVWLFRVLSSVQFDRVFLLTFYRVSSEFSNLKILNINRDLSYSPPGSS